MASPVSDPGGDQRVIGCGVSRSLPPFVLSLASKYFSKIWEIKKPLLNVFDLAVIIFKPSVSKCAFYVVACPTLHHLAL